VSCAVGDLSCMEYTVQYFCSLWEVGYGGYEIGFVGCVGGHGDVCGGWDVWGVGEGGSVLLAG
jgi:hypothetical protein